MIPRSTAGAGLLSPEGIRAQGVLFQETDSMIDAKRVVSGIGEQHPLPFVSIVVPAYNAATTIRLCLDAIQQLDYPRERVEVIVVDNNSQDGTDEIVRDYDVTLVYERSMQSAYAARNAGIRHATGDIVALTDADCIVDRHWLRRLVKPFEDKNVGGAGGQVLDFQATNLVETFIQRYMPYEQCLPSKDRPLAGLITGNAAYRRQDLIDVGLFNTMFDCSDIDLSWRVQVQTGKCICFVPEAIVYHKHRSSLTSLFWWQYRFGFGQIIMTCLHRDATDSFYSRDSQLRSMVKQIKALITYVLSFIYRSVLWATGAKERDPLYLLSPLLFSIVDSGLLLGRIKGLWTTRFFTVDVSTRTWEEPVKKR